jgi:hypothetical protein
MSGKDIAHSPFVKSAILSDKALSVPVATFLQPEWEMERIDEA